MQPQYPPQQPQYPPTPPQAYPPPPPPPPTQQPQYPPAPQTYAPPTPPPAYAPPAPQAYAPQGYPPQYGQPPMPAPVAGTLDDFYTQPSTGGGKSLAFEAVGTTYTGIVTRPIGNGDIEQQTNPQSGAPAFFKDGRPKFVMKVPLQMQPSAAYPDGLAQWYCRGSARDDLVRAMAEAGAPEGPPEVGAVITITMIGSRPSGAGLNPTKLFQVQYRRPQGAPSGSVPAAAVERVAGGQPPQYTPPASVTTGAVAPAGIQTTYQPAPPPVYATNGNGAPPPPAPPAPVTTTALAPPPAMPQATPPPPAPAAELSPEQQQLLAQLTGQ